MKNFLLFPVGCVLIIGCSPYAETKPRTRSPISAYPSTYLEPSRFDTSITEESGENDDDDDDDDDDDGSGTSEANGETYAGNGGPSHDSGSTSRPRYNNGVVDSEPDAPGIDLDSRLSKYRQDISQKKAGYQAVAGALVAGGVAVAAEGTKRAVNNGREFLTEGARISGENIDAARAAGAYKCPTCNGYGRVDVSPTRITFDTCSRCDGNGWLKNGVPFNPRR